MADETRTGVVSSGALTITIRTTRQQRWRITQLTNEMTSPPAGAACNLRKNGYLVTPLLPNRDAATGDPPVELLPADVLTVEWTGVTNGTLGKVYYVYENVPYDA